MYRVLEDVLTLGWTALRKPLESFMLPSASLGDGIILCRDGSLATLFHVDGCRRIMGDAELEEFVETALRRLNTAFAAPGHALHVVLERSPEEIGVRISRIGDMQRRNGLDLGDLIEERGRRMSSLCAEETLVFAAWTRPSLLAPKEQKRDRRRIAARLRPWIADLRDTQCQLAAWDSLLPRHEAFNDTLALLLEETGMVARRLDDPEALGVMRQFLNASPPAGHHPVTAPARITEPPENGAFPPSLAPQLLCTDPERCGGALRVGTRTYRALDMILGARRARPFTDLMARIHGMPFRISILIEGGAMQRLDTTLARVAAAFLAFSSHETRLVRNAMQGLQAYSAESGAVVRLRLGLLTWVGDGKPDDSLSRRLNLLQQLAEGWCEMVFSPLIGDQLEALAAAIPGFCCGGTAVPAILPLPEALRLLPVSRPASRGEAGHMFRSLDGKLLPGAAADDSDYAFELIYGLPGHGKSVLMNTLTLEACLSATRLPLVSIIDIGPSSSGLISLIREALPPERRDEAGWFRLHMTASHAINPCDTQLGCRRPLPAERAFLENLLCLILTPAGENGVPDGMRELIGPTIDQVYAIRSDGTAGGEPNRYTAGRDREVDRALEQCGIRPGETWWETVDLLFQAGRPDAAGLAQRYAVPVLGDMLAAVREPSVQGLVANATFGRSAESVTDAFIRIMTSLAGDWPAMFAPTVFDIGSARVAAIDLKEVAPHGSFEADRQTAAFYMLARHALTREWWIGDEALEEIEEPYRAWHAGQLRLIRETPKRLAFDEFHRIGSAPAIRAQVERDVRESRKQRVRIVLASQRLDDFGEALVELASRYWILGSGGKEAELEQLSRIFSLGDTLRKTVVHNLTGPGRDGAPALVISIGNQGRFEQLAINTPGPVELWALTTSPRDAALRDRLYARLPPAEARRVLARRFPTGSAAREESPGVPEEETVERLVTELVNQARENGS